MKTTQRRALVVCALSIAFACVMLSSCNSSNSSSGEQPSGQPLLINAAGSTFAYPIYSKWFNSYHQQHSNVEFNYASIGSGGGIAQLRAVTVDVGASDMPMNDQLLGTFKVKVLQFPIALGADVPAYNLPGINAELKFTPQTLAGIYLGKITKWNDPELTRVNPGVKLPNQKIIVVHRSDGSGTTFIWCDYLSKISSEWKKKVGANTSVNWPVGLGGKGNEGVVGLVQQTPYSIGYAELTYCLQNNMLYGTVQNSSGNFIKATLASVTAAAADNASELQRDIRASITNAPGANSYPISSFTYLLVPASIPNAAKRDAIKDFLTWMLSEGQTQLQTISYAPLPSAMLDVEKGMIPEIQ
ncbi:MAG TPA: phosphate ABC transporter substrate-binding protein PstS [Terriglobia bacterium]|nr:phosphate ABC transporter substrate-binding protein PstS [Terriglobia bacterium]